MNPETQRTQEFQLNGDEVVAKVKELIHEGNIRRITIKNEDGRTMLEVPLTLGLIGAALLPVLAARNRPPSSTQPSGVGIPATTSATPMREAMATPFQRPGPW